MTARVQSQCTPSCARYLSPLNPANTAGVIACAAFPTGIPDSIWNNQVDHRQPVDGDHGLQWVAAPGYSYPVYALDTSDAPTLTAADEPAGHTGAMVALIPADPAALAIEGGEAAEQLHCTLLYLGEAADISPEDRAGILAAVQDVAKAWPTTDVMADAFGVGSFNPTGDEPCLVLLLSGEEIADLHDQIAEVVEASEDQHRPWIPHVTLAYAGPDAPAEMTQQSEAVDLTGEPVMFDKLRVAFGGEVTDFPLGEQAADTPEPDDTAPEPEPQPEPEPAAVTAAAVREVWNGCPRCFGEVHAGPCRIGL